MFSVENFITLLQNQQSFDVSYLIRTIMSNLTPTDIAVIVIFTTVGTIAFLAIVGVLVKELMTTRRRRHRNHNLQEVYSIRPEVNTIDPTEGEHADYKNVLELPSYNEAVQM